jgi:hypothetical protein
MMRRDCALLISVRVLWLTLVVLAFVVGSCTAAVTGRGLWLAAKPTSPDTIPRNTVPVPSDGPAILLPNDSSVGVIRGAAL